MNKGKLKRLRKTLDRLRQEGRHWEWLRQVEQEGLVEEQKKEWNEVWYAVVKRALRAPAGLEEFILYSEGLKEIPKTPDTDFLMQLIDALEGRSEAQALKAPSGISLQAEPLLQRLQTLDNALPEKEAAKQFQLFIKKPLQIQEEHFQRLSACMTGTKAGDSVREMGRCLNVLAQGTGKHRIIHDSDRYRRIDNQLKNIAVTIQTDLFELLLYPFLYHLNNTVSSFVKKDDFGSLAELVSGSPFLFGRLAEDKAASVKEQLVRFSAGEIDKAAVNRVIREGTAEEKAAMIGRVRMLFKDEDQAYVIIKLYLNLLESFFLLIAKQRAGMSAREQGEMSGVFDRMLKTDLPLFLESPESAEVLARILSVTADAGWLSMKTALLSVLLGERLHYGKLRHAGEETARRLGKPAREDVDWVIRQCNVMIFPEMGVLRPLLRLCQDDSTLMKHISTNLLMDIFAEVALLPVLKKVERLGRSMGMPDDLMPMSHDVRLLMKEIGLLKDLPNFSEFSAFYDAFPKGVLSDISWQQFLNSMAAGSHGMDHALFVADSMLKKTDHIIDSMGYIVDYTDTARVYKILSDGFVAFLSEHLQKLLHVRPAAVGHLLNILALFSFKGWSSAYNTALMNVYNLLGQRSDSGEENMLRFKTAVKSMMAPETKQPARQYGRPAKKQKSKPKQPEQLPQDQMDLW